MTFTQHPNPLARSYHLRHIPSEHCKASVRSLLGIEDCNNYCERYSVSIIRAHAYSWDELHDKIVATLEHDAATQADVEAYIDQLDRIY